MQYMGDYADDSTVRIFFTTNDGSGGAVAPSTAFEAADVVIYKNNSATQKATTNGITMISPFDTVTGLHLVEIDCSNDTGDAGFWATGNDYSVVLSPDETVDSQTVVAAIAQFSIENRIVSAVKGTVNGVAGTIQTLDALDTAQDTQHSTTQSAISALNNFDPTSDTVANVTTVGSVLGSVGSVSAAVTTDSASRTASQADVSALATAAAVSTIDSNVDAVLVDTGTTLPATLSTVEGKVDTVDGNVDAILVDTGTTLPATLSTIEGKVDTVDSNVDAVLVDTGTTLPATLSTMDGKIDTVDGIVDDILPDTGTDGLVLSTATLQSIADEILKRDVDNVEATANEHTLATIILCLLESSRSATTWTIKRSDGTTTHATKTLTLDSAANPVVGVD